MLQHILNKYPIPPGRVLDEHMGYRSDQFPILNNRTAGHSLHHAAGQLQKLRIGDLKDNALGAVAAGIVHLFDLNLVVLYLAGDTASKEGGTGGYLLAVAYGDSLAHDPGAEAFIGCAEDAGFCVGLNLA